jgi:UDP-hydrolysing UDP-N-acetyl-D-glucosamine 2-epimerase
MRTVCVVVGSRANYGSIKSAMQAIDAHPGLELQVVAGASAVLDRFGAVVELMESDGFEVSARVYMLIEGETPAAMAKSTGLGLVELPSVFEHLKPDIVMTVGDRFETMATAVAAAYMNIALAHTMGGEVTGNIDESVRHAVTKLSNIHFPASKMAGENIIRMGEEPSTVHVVGCPRVDVAAQLVAEGNGHVTWKDMKLWEGVGPALDLSEPFLMVAQHPVTSEFDETEAQITETLQAVVETGMQCLLFWPNADAGQDGTARGIRKLREHDSHAELFHVVKNLPVDLYMRLMTQCACIIGNSSSSVREGAFLGVPAVNIGSRQMGREKAANIIDVPPERHEIVRAIRTQVEHGRYDSDHVYGDGQAGPRIAQILSEAEIHTQKRLSY